MSNETKPTPVRCWTLKTKSGQFVYKYDDGKYTLFPGVAYEIETWVGNGAVNSSLAERAERVLGTPCEWVEVLVIPAMISEEEMRGVNTYKLPVTSNVFYVGFRAACELMGVKIRKEGE